MNKWSAGLRDWHDDDDDGEEAHDEDEAGNG